MANKLIQWNCRGLKANFNELLLLLTGLCPSIICLQETFLKPTDNLNIRGYTLYNHIHQAGDRASGGSSIVVNNSVPQSLPPCRLGHRICRLHPMQRGKIPPKRGRPLAVGGDP